MYKILMYKHLPPPPQRHHTHAKTPRTSGTAPGGDKESAVAELSPVIVIKTMLGMQAVAIEDIVCCIAAGKNALLHCTNEDKPLPVFHSLSDIAKRLEEYPQFVGCHRSTLLNLAHCKSWRHDLKEAVALVHVGKTVKEVSVSRTCKETFIRRWDDYFCQNVRKCNNA